MNIAKVLRTKLLFKCQLLLILVLKVKFKTMYKSPDNKNWIKLPIILTLLMTAEKFTCITKTLVKFLSRIATVNDSQDCCANTRLFLLARPSFL